MSEGSLGSFGFHSRGFQKVFHLERLMSRIGYYRRSRFLRWRSAVKYCPKNGSPAIAGNK